MKLYGMLLLHLFLDVACSTPRSRKDMKSTHFWLKASECNSESELVLIFSDTVTLERRNEGWFLNTMQIRSSASPETWERLAIRTEEGRVRVSLAQWPIVKEELLVEGTWNSISLSVGESIETWEGPGTGCAEHCEACTGPTPRDCVGLWSNSPAVMGPKAIAEEWSVAWRVDALKPNTVCVRLEKVACPGVEESMCRGVEINTDESGHLRMCEYAGHSMHCESALHFPSGSSVRLSNSIDTLYLCAEKANDASCVNVNASWLKESQIQYYSVWTDYEVAWECFALKKGERQPPRHLPTYHYARFAYRRTLTSHQVDSYTFVNTHVNTVSIVVTLFRPDGNTPRPRLDLYKPYSGTADWSDTSSTRMITVTPSNSVIISKGGSMMGPYTVKVTEDNNTSYLYEVNVLITCQDVSGTCFCAAGTYPNPDASSCSPCPVSSASCPAMSSLGCIPVTKSTSMAANTFTCDTCYPTTSFLMQSSGTCGTCASSCATCSGTTANDCLSCTSASTSLQTPPGPSACVCNPGTYPNPTIPTCATCNVSCLTCSAAGTNKCTSCKSNAALVGLISPGTCACSAGFAGSPSNCVAAGCDTSCSTCSVGGTTSADCMSCQTNAQLAAAGPSTCQCVSEYFGIPPTCTPCDPTCATCNGALPTSCTGCVALIAHISGTSCICSSGYYGTPPSCILCDTFCTTCAAAGEDQCTACQSNAWLSAGSPGPCECSSGFYANPDPANCASCDSTCLTCIGGTANDCSSCHANASLPLGFSSGTCACNNGFYPAPTVVACSVCSVTCQLCVGPGTTQCTGCQSNAQLLNGVSTGSCVCSSGYWPNPDASLCDNCDPTCQSCTTGGLLGCSTCHSGASLSGPIPSACVCNSGFYQSGGFCLACSTLCATCQGPDTIDCLSCKSGAVLEASTCACASGYMGIPDASNCVSCGPNCTSCDISGCLKCSIDWFLLDGQCLTSCPQYYAGIASVCSPVAPVPSLLITTSNGLSISFDQPMLFSSLSASDFSVSVVTPAQVPVDATWTQPDIPDTQSISISLSFTVTYLPPNCTATLTFLDASKFVNSLKTSITILTLNGTLNGFGSKPETSALSTPVAAQTTSAVQGAITASVISSVLTGNPGSLASFVGNIQIMSYIAMTKIDIPQNLAATLAALNVGSAISIPYTDRLDTGDSSQNTTDYVNNYGISSTLLLVNINPFVFTFAGVLLSYVPIYALSRLPYPTLAPYFARLLPSLKWGAPLRLWLPAYLDIAIYSLLQVINTSGSVSSVYLAFNLALGYICLAIVLATPILLSVVMWTYIWHMTSRSDEALNKRWGVLYLEMQSSDPIATVYYLPYILRRLLFALSLTVTADYPAFIALLNLSMAGAMSIYITSTRVFEDKVDQLTAILTEVGTFLVYTIVSTFLLSQPDSLRAILAEIGIWTARVTVFGNLAASMYKTTVTVVKVVKAYRKQMQAVEKRITSSTQEIALNYNPTLR